MKRFVGWIIALVVLVGVVVAVDRVGVHLVESTVETGIEQSGHGVTDANVDIHGFPFLTQLAGGELSHVTGSASTAQFGGVEVTGLSFDVDNMKLSSPYHVDSGTASATVTTSSLQSLARTKSKMNDLNVEVDGDSLKFSESMLGQTLSVDAQPTVNHNTVDVKITGVALNGNALSMSSLPSFISSKLTNISVPISVPEGVTVTGAKVVDGGLRVSVQGKDVGLADLVAS